jgi:L-rhamnose mutarotase
MVTIKMTDSAAGALASAFLLGAGTVLLQRYYLNQSKQACNSRGISIHEKANNLEESLPAPRRFGAAIQLKRDQYRRYRELHDNVWEDVLQRMHQSNIRNFVIYYHEETSTLFQSFEWIGHWNVGTGADSKVEEERLFERDMKAIADDPVTRKWWQECEPCQKPFSQWLDGSAAPSQGGSGDWWAPMECLCHTGHWPTAYSRHRQDPDFIKLAK